MAVERVRFYFEIDSGNDAVVSDPERCVSNALSDVSSLVDQGARSGVIKDTNGNTIGSWDFEIVEDNSEF